MIYEAPLTLPSPPAYRQAGTRERVGVKGGLGKILKSWGRYLVECNHVMDGVINAKRGSPEKGIRIFS